MYAAQQWLEPRSDSIGIPKLLDPALLRAARRIFRIYQEVHPELDRRPIGVAIHEVSQRGMLLFSRKPVLLPGERFVPLDQMESEMY